MTLSVVEPYLHLVGAAAREQPLNDNVPLSLYTAYSLESAAKYSIVHLKLPSPYQICEGTSSPRGVEACLFIFKVHLNEVGGSSLVLFLDLP